MKRFVMALLLGSAPIYADEFDFDFSEFAAEIENETVQQPSDVSAALQHGIAWQWQDDLALVQHQMVLDLNYQTSVSSHWYFTFDGEVGADLRETQLFDEFLALNELHLQASYGEFAVTLGKQKVTWGEVEGAPALDVITPTQLSVAENQTATQWLFNGQWYMNKATAQLVFVPKAKVINVTMLPDEQPDWHPQWGGKLKWQLQNSDVSLYVGQFINPMLLANNNQLQEDRYNLLGISANRALGSLLLKADLGYKHGLAAWQYDALGAPELVDYQRVDSALGSEYTWQNGVSLNSMLSLQYTLGAPDGYYSVETFAQRPLQTLEFLWASMLSDSYFDNDLTLTTALAVIGELDMVTWQINADYLVNDAWQLQVQNGFNRAKTDSLFASLDKQIDMRVVTRFNF